MFLFVREKDFHAPFLENLLTIGGKFALQLNLGAQFVSFRGVLQQF